MISALFVRRTGDDPDAKILMERLKSEGFDRLQNLFIEKRIRFQGIPTAEAMKLEPLLRHPMAESVTRRSTLDKNAGPIIEVGYQRAVTDPELPSILRSSVSLGIESLEWVRIAHRYQFLGIAETTAKEIVHRYLYNPQVQVLISSDEEWESLKPRGETGPVELIPLKGMDREALRDLSDRMRLFLNDAQMRSLQQISEKLNRSLTDAEIEMFAQTWSDHCFHTTWKSLGLLKTLWEATNEIDHPLVLSVFEDNAGAVAFYDGWALTIKGETHNSPSAVSPYGGIATKHGGVIRDTLGCGQGAWPIGGSTVMGLGDPRMEWSHVPEGALHPKTILVESIRGTADYTNPMGIPMMFPVYRFHPGYTGKCFALGHSIGLIPASRAKKGHPDPGDIAVLIGGLTGRDGIHGATVSSGSMTSETAIVDAAHVQIGHPIEERKFMEAIPVLRDHECLRAITDLGAAGLSSAAGEMGSETGIWINLAWVPLKTEGLHPWEIWISESQERMLLCVPPEKIGEAVLILERYEVPAAIVGKFTNTRRCQVVYDVSIPNTPGKIPEDPGLSGETVIDLAFLDLRKGCPLPEIHARQPESSGRSLSPPAFVTPDQYRDAIRDVLSHLNICDQSAAGHQFDNTIQGSVAAGPYGGKSGRMPEDVWASTPVRGKPYAALTALGYNPYYGEVDPAGMARLMMIEPITKLVAAGVDPGDIVLCDNFYTPRVNETIAWILKQMVLACCELSKELKTPFISGKDSSSGTFIGNDGERLDIPPTLAVMAMGRLAEIRNLIRKHWKKPGNDLLLVGPTAAELGGSIYLDTIGERGTKLPRPSSSQLKDFWRELRRVQSKGCIRSASAIAEGGLIRRIFEMALGSGMGCEIDFSPLRQRLNTDDDRIALFAEMIGSILIEADAHCPEAKEGLNGVPLGRIIEDPVLKLKTKTVVLELPMKDLITAWEKPFREAAR